MPFEKSKKMEAGEVAETKNDEIVTEKNQNNELETEEFQQLASSVTAKDQQKLDDIQKEIAAMPMEHNQKEAEKNNQDVYANLTRKSSKPLSLKRASKLAWRELRGIPNFVSGMLSSPWGGMRNLGSYDYEVPSKQAGEYTGTINGQEFSIKVTSKNEMNRPLPGEYIPNADNSDFEVTLDGKKLSPQDSLEFYKKFYYRPQNPKEWLNNF